jgi:hypothetical protein
LDGGARQEGKKARRTAEPPSSPDSRLQQRWRDWLPIHPAANLFHLLSKDEQEELSRDIKENGLHQPCHIIADEDGQPVLLDRRNRPDALEHIGEEITLDRAQAAGQMPDIPEFLQRAS